MLVGVSVSIEAMISFVTAVIIPICETHGHITRLTTILASTGVLLHIVREIDARE